MATEKKIEEVHVYPFSHQILWYENPIVTACDDDRHMLQWMFLSGSNYEENESDSYDVLLHSTYRQNTLD